MSSPLPIPPKPVIVRCAICNKNMTLHSWKKNHQWTKTHKKLVKVHNYVKDLVKKQTFL